MLENTVQGIKFNKKKTEVNTGCWQDRGTKELSQETKQDEGDGSENPDSWWEAGKQSLPQWPLILHLD